jgi:tetratricopeptide (TPR) repeat protein
VKGTDANKNNEYSFFTKKWWGKFTILYLLIGMTLQIKAGHEVDSLLLVLKNAKSDSVKCLNLSYLLELSNDIGEKTKYAASLRKIAARNLSSGTQKKFFLKELEIYYNFMGFYEFMTGEVDRSISMLKKGLNIAIALNDKEGMSNLQNSMGIVYQMKGDIDNSLYYLTESHKNAVLTKSDEMIASIMGNIANIYQKQGDIYKAMESYLEIIDAAHKMGKKVSEAKYLMNLGVLYDEEGDPVCKLSAKDCGVRAKTKALECFLKSYDLCRSEGENITLSLVAQNIGTFYLRTKNYPLALKFYLEAEKACKTTNDPYALSGIYKDLAVYYTKTNDVPTALKYGRRAFAMSETSAAPENIMNAADALKKIYLKMNDHKNALLMFELYIKMKDSISSQSSREKMMRKQYKFEYDKRSAADSVAHAKENEIKQVELSRQSAEIKAKKNQQYALFGGMFFVCLFGVFMFNRYKVTQKQKFLIEHQKEIVEEQKKLVDEKQREVLDSIRYAQRIQLASMPTEKQINLGIKRLRKI